MTARFDMTNATLSWVFATCAALRSSFKWIANMVKSFRFYYNFWLVHQMLLFYLNSTCSFIKHRQISTESDRCKSGKETSHPVFTLSIFWTGKVLFFRRGVKLLLVFCEGMSFQMNSHSVHFTERWRNISVLHACITRTWQTLYGACRSSAAPFWLQNTD